MLQSTRLLERSGCCQKTIYSCQGFRGGRKKWLVKQALWRIYFSQHHATFLGQSLMSHCPMQCIKQTFVLPHKKLPHGKKIYKYALTVVDVASRYKAAEPLTSKESDEVSKAFQRIYKRGPLKWSQLLQVDPGREFMGAVTKVMENNKTSIRRGRTEIHRDQAIVERFNRTLVERLFGYQYAVEMNITQTNNSNKRSTEWVKRLPEVVSALNNEVTQLISKKPAEAIKEKSVYSKPATPYSRPVGLNEKKLTPQVNVRYLFQPGELEGGGKRATDPIWSLKVYNIEKVVTKPKEPVMCYLYDSPKRGFVREELMVVPPDIVLPPLKSM